MKDRILTGLLFTLAMALFIVPGFWSPLPPFLLFLLVLWIGGDEIRKALDHASPDHAAASRAPWGKSVATSVLLSGTTAILYGFQSDLSDMTMTLSGWFEFLLHGPKTVSPTLTIPLAGFGLAVLLYLSAMLLVILREVLRQGAGQFGKIVGREAGTFYVVFPVLVAVVMLYAVPDGICWVVAALLTPWITDVVAYFTGSLLGRHKIIPALSPKKSWEGCIGGLVGSMAVLPLWVVLVIPSASSIPQARAIVFSLIVGLVVGIAAQAGDWFASSIKRWAGIKDFGTLLPGHGGVLDRFDSVFFTLPVFFAASLVHTLL